MKKRRPQPITPGAAQQTAEPHADHAAPPRQAETRASSLAGDRARLAARVWLCAILVLLFASRFANLQYQGFHHDESIHCLNTWRIVHDTVREYRYDPVYHGPFMYHFGALVTSLLPDANYAGRVPFAISGVVLVLLFLLWKRRLGAGAPLLVMTFLVFSAVVNYFSRFAREDVHMLAWFAGAVVTGTLYLLTTRVRFLTVAAWFAALAYCTKESSYINNFALCSFLVLWALLRLARDPRAALRDIFVRYVALTRFLVVLGCFSLFTFSYVALDSRIGPKTSLAEGIGKIVSHSTSIKQKTDVSAFEGESGYFTAQGRENARRTYFRAAFGVSLALLLLTELFSLLLDADLRRPAWRIPVLLAVAAGFYGLLAYRIVSLEAWLAVPEPMFRAFPSYFARELARRIAAGSGLLALTAAILVVPDAVRLTLGILPGAGSASRLGALRQAAVLWRDRILELWGLILQVMGAVFMYVLLFTSVGTNLPYGMKSGLYDYLAYWFKHQTGDYRIWGVWWYYVPRLLLFDLLPLVLILVLAAAFAWRAIAGLGRRAGGRPRPEAAAANELSRSARPAPEGAACDERIWRPLPLPLLVFAGYAAIYMIGVYALLNEKVPWLGTYQSFALSFLAALLAAHWMATRKTDVGNARRAGAPARGVGRIAAYVLFGILACFAIGQHLTTVFFRPDCPEELLTYTQTTREFAERMREVDRQRLVAQARGNKLRLSVKGKAEWPCCWYFRNDDVRYRTTDPSRDFQIADDTTDDRRRMQPSQGPVWEIEQTILRGWWHHTENVSGLPGGHSFLRNVGAFLRNVANDHLAKFPPNRRPDANRYAAGFRDQVLRYVFLRQIWTPTDGERVLFARKTDKTIAPEIEEITLKGMNAPPRMASVLGVYGVGPPDPIRLTQPRGVAVTSEGNVVVVDSGGGRVVVLSPTADILFDFGKGVLSPSYSGAGGVAVDAGGNFIVADTWNHALRRFSPEGRLLKTATAGLAAGQGAAFYGPRGVAIGPDGRIYATDTGNKAVRVFDADLNPLFSWGLPGDAPGSFEEPVGIAIDSEGRVYVADTGNGRIQQFDSEGRFLTQFLTVKPTADETVRAEPYLIHLRNGQIAMSFSITDSIWIVDPKTKEAVLYEIERPKVADPVGLAQCPDGTMWITDRETGKLYHIRLPGLSTRP